MVIRRLALLLLIGAAALGGSLAPSARAQRPAEPVAPPEPPPPPQQVPAGYAIQRDVNLVLLHVTVDDAHGQFVPGLGRESFRVYEDGVEQQISVLRQEDVPVSMGLLIDNSGSMEDKRPGVNAAAMTLVKTSNPVDEVFVAHFNDNYYFDLPEPFTSDVAELSKALEHLESDGATALYDAILSALGHLKSGYNDKKVLFIVSDGEDNYSRSAYAATLEQAQRSNAMIYAVGLLSEEKPESAERDRRALTGLSEATGGEAFFPESVPQVESICTQIAHDIRHQYTIGYYSSNPSRDGTFRSVRVTAFPPPGQDKVSVRTRSGYFARADLAGK